MGQIWRGHSTTRQSTNYLRHSHTKEIFLNVKKPPRRGSFPTIALSVLNANACVPDWQVAPAYPGWQLQTYPLTWSVHDPPFKQGLLEHSLMSVAKSTNYMRKVNFSWQSVKRLITTFARTIQGSITLKLFLTCLTLCSCVSRLTATSISISLVSTRASF